MASNFQDVFIFAIHEFICVIFLVVETHLGAPGTPKMYPNCQNFNFLSLVVEVSNCHDLLLYGLEKCQLC